MNPVPGWQSPVSDRPRSLVAASCGPSAALGARAAVAFLSGCLLAFIMGKKQGAALLRNLDGSKRQISVQRT